MDGAAVEAASVAIYSKYLPRYLPPAEQLDKSEPPGPRSMALDELRSLLGQVETDEHGEALLTPKYADVSDPADFEARRQAMYTGEAQVAAASIGLPEGWAARLSTSEPREIFYVHVASNSTQWERPP